MRFLKIIVVFLLMSEIGFGYQMPGEYRILDDHVTRIISLENKIKNNSVDIDNLKKIHAVLGQEIRPLKEALSGIDNRINSLEYTLKQVKEARETFSETDQKKIEQLETIINQLLEYKKSLEQHIEELGKISAKNAQDIASLKKLFEDYIQKKLAVNIPGNLVKADNLVKQIQAFTKITRLRNGRNGQSVIFNLQLSEARNGKQVPLASRQLVVGEQILDGPFKESFTIDTDMDGIASFEASEDKRREMNKRQAFFVIKFKGDALRKDATSSKFR